MNNLAKNLLETFLVLRWTKSEQNSLGTTGRQINWLSDQEIDYQVLLPLHLPFKGCKTLLPMMLNLKFI